MTSPAARFDRSRCASCGTELPPHALACPACSALVHAERLKQHAARAAAAAEADDLTSARDEWTAALALLPPESRQHALIRERLDAIAKRIEATSPATTSAPPDPHAGWWRRGIGVIVTVGLLLLGKLKFLLLGLTKASTFFSMFAFFGVYWGLYGWPLALGLVLSIYIHEMGHVAMLRRLGIAAGAPLFIPGVGALVMLKQHIDDPVVDAKIGLAGPVWGLGAGLAAFGMYAVTGVPVWRAIGQLTGFINLFNLIPVWQLDGSRGFHALNRAERWIVIAAIALVLYLTGQRFLWLVGGVAVWRALQKEQGPGDWRVASTFVGLIAALAWMAREIR